MSIAADALARLVEGIDRERLGAYGAVVRIGDDEVAHRWRSDDRENLHSVSKGVCAVAVGIAVDEGILRLDTRVPELLPDLDLGPGVDGVTVEHLLTMTSGIDFAWFGDEPVPGPDLAQAMLGLPSRGRVFRYSDASPYVALRMLAAAVGDVRDWLLPRLFEPLGIENPQWHRCPLGFIVGGSGLELRTGELARIGRLLGDRGAWEGRQLVSAEWVDRMHGTWVDTGHDDPAAPSPATASRPGTARATPGASTAATASTCWSTDPATRSSPSRPTGRSATTGSRSWR
ncbi:serine hydrolase domain-containing protein [Clavibacter sp. CFBP 8614]|uniref:serine hydrolase domain-containing protein n=1 Tax=unclassified Clavibacter TaxID=2626594 RepID=UPI0040432BC0